MDVRGILGRDEHSFDDSRTDAALRGKTVLVTGAGGSIGSELCSRLRQRALERLVLFEQSESSLVDLDRSSTRVPATAVLGDVTDGSALRSLMAATKPDIVYHAAALKHVVLLETHPIEAARTNVLGTQNVIAACSDTGVRDLVLLSTDKAVSPTSFMGATKNLGEQLVRAAGRGGGLRTIVVRLVNVARSRGSAVPRFMQQAAAGIPLALSSPDASRRFLSRGEAASLLMAATWLGDAGDTLVPDLGEPRLMIDVARAVLRHAGREETAFHIVGLGPGEKMHESLLGDGEIYEPSEIDGVIRIPLPPAAAELDLSTLEQALDRRDIPTVVACMRGAVPGYDPSPLLAPNAETSRADG